MIPTKVEALAALMPAMAEPAPAAWEMSEMPAVTDRARIAVSRYHCGVRSASG